MFKFHVIFIFEKDFQLNTYLEFDHPPTEAQFLFEAMDFLTYEQLSRLRRINAAQCDTEDDSRWLSWIKNSNGRYFFDIVRNPVYANLRTT